MKRVKLKVAYDGTNYCGWQIQKNGKTIEQVLNKQLSRLLKEDIRVIGASRTDAGVHALGNVAVFDTNSRIPADKISYALNQSLPDDISIVDSRQVADDFHPRHCNSIKSYEYRILNTPFPIPNRRFYTYFYHRPLDMEAMNEAARYLLGEHDFASFCSANAQVRETTRTVYQAEFCKEGDELVFTIKGNGFLYNMVRIIVGTLVEVGIGRYAPKHVKEIIDSRDRTNAGPCAPAAGLTLVKIDYEETLAPQLVVENDRMFYSLVQKDIVEKQYACLNIYWCEKEDLEGLIARMATKVYRLGAKQLYVQCHEYPFLEKVIQKNSQSMPDQAAGNLAFTAGEHAFMLHHTVEQMDREMQANPPVMPHMAQPLTLQPIEHNEQQEVFFDIYKECFWDKPCTYTYTREEIQALCEDKERTPYLLYVKEEPAGILLMETKQMVTGELCPAIACLGICGKWRRKGLASAAVELAAFKTKEQGYPRLTLEVASDNHEARQLYITHGFYPIHTKLRWYVATDTGKRKIPDGKSEDKQTLH